MSASKKVFIASIATETNTFSPLRTGLSDFIESFYAKPGEHPATPTLCSAVFPVARKLARTLDWELIEGTATWAEPGGIVNQHTWEFLRDQLLNELRNAMPVDIVLLGLHGAMVSQNCTDCEGELLEMVRTLVGPEVIVGVSFDPHSHLSDRRIQNADVITAFKEFPHTDFVDTAEHLINLVYRMSIGEITPCISVHDCQMIEIFPTSREPMRSFVDRIKAIEGHDKILSVSIIHGFMAGDVPDLGTKVIVITDDDKSTGDVMATKLGHKLYEYRGQTRPEFLDIESALDKANVAHDKPVVIADVWDNPGGGVPGDSTIILRAMLARRIKNASLATIWDPIAVRTCLSAGVGATLMLRFGGKMSASAGEPIDALVTVKNIVESAVQSFGESVVPLGDSVWIDVNGIDVILNTVRSQVFNPDAFTNMGIDPTNKSLLVVKSTNHFHAAFNPIAATILYVAVDGPYPSDPETNDYQNLKRSIWPRAKHSSSC